jgi:hypothetical protein
MARPVRVSTLAYNGVQWGDNYAERARDAMAQCLQLAAGNKPDLVAFTEWCNVLGVPIGQDEGQETLADWAEPIPGPTTDRLAEIADRHNMYVVVPIPELDGDTIYNTAAFIDRNGQIIAKYHKYQPTITEMQRGTTPGTDAPAFDTDFGKVGAAICFDLKFVEVGQTLAANGARLVVFASMFEGGQRIVHWARDFGFYIVSSCGSRSYIADMSGNRFLAETGHAIQEVSAGTVPPIASAVINMDRELFHLDYNIPRLKACVEKYGMGVEWEICRPEAHFTLASNMPDKTIEDLIEEFELETWRDYLARARRCRADALAGRNLSA